jgi:hypothetical protein
MEGGGISAIVVYILWNLSKFRSTMASIVSKVRRLRVNITTFLLLVPHKTYTYTYTQDEQIQCCYYYYYYYYLIELQIGFYQVAVVLH